MPHRSRSPAELRNMFGANLRELSTKYASISDLSRQLGINRTQFNRYLSGESFPRPDVLDRICSFFGVDARILLRPVETLVDRTEPLGSDFLRDFVGAGTGNVPETDFPSGFYRFSRRSFTDDARFVIGLVYVFREGPSTYIRGYEARAAMREQGLPSDTHSREFRGFVMRQEGGIAALISRRKAMTCSFNYLSRIASFENNVWSGYVTRTVHETVNGTRATRMVYEHLGRNTRAVLATARQGGFVNAPDLLPFHRRLLQPDIPFS
jgi:transcriptional regulator with XRE-family HTH domain